MLNLRPYQIAGAVWLAPKTQAFLADDMGLGKSAQVIHAADLVRAEDILVLCPASVRVSWEREFRKFSPFDRPTTVITSGKDAIPEHGLVICSYDLGVILADKLKARHWDILVLDEAHYLKERSAKRSRLAYGRGSRQPGLNSRATRVWRLSGTPAPNDASELFTHLKSAGIVTEPYWDFVFRYCDGFENDFGYQIKGHKNTEELKQRMAGFLLRRRKEEVLTELPPISFDTVVVPRSKVELDPWFYDQWRAIGQPAFLKQLEEANRVVMEALRRAPDENDKLRELERSASATATLRRYIGLAKLPAILDIIEDELKTGALQKIVLFGIHQQVIEQARERLKPFGAVTVYGGTPADKRQKNIDKFAKDPKTRVFIGNIVAAGVGINGLQESCCEVGFLESDWVPANNAQAAMRVHRMGQTNPVRVRVFALEKSIDDEIQEALTRKMRELAKIF